MTTHERLAPHSDEAERGVLGCILLDPKTGLDRAVELLPAGVQSFYDVRHRNLFCLLLQMQTDGEQIDHLMLSQRIRDNAAEVGGIDYVSSLPDCVPSVENIQHYTHELNQKLNLRRTITACSDAIAKAREMDDASTVLDGLESQLGQIRGEEGGQVLAPKETMLDLIDQLEMRARLEGRRGGVVTGFDELDRLLDGLQYGEQTILAARPSAGKTALALNIVNRACLDDGIPTVFFTFEMSPAALARRLLSQRAEIPIWTLRSGIYSEEERRRIVVFQLKYQHSPIYVVNAVSGMTAGRLAAIFMRLWRKHGIKLAVIDYLQKIRPTVRHEKRTYEVEEVSTAVRSLAVKTKTAFLTLAQLNRESEKERNRVPRLSDLRDSGAIEQDADCVLLLHRDRTAQDKPAKVIVAKQRDGECGPVELTFDGNFVQFKNPRP